MGGYEDLTGRKFGRLTVVGLSDLKKPYCGRVWECRCDCGNTAFVDTSSLKRGNTKSCGCLRSRPRAGILGCRFGRLTVVAYEGGGVYRCQCACGTLTRTTSRNLKSGNTKSCGCLGRKATRATIPAPRSASEAAETIRMLEDAYGLAGKRGADSGNGA